MTVEPRVAVAETREIQTVSHTVGVQQRTTLERFNGTATFTNDVYDNTLLRDRPLVNNQWQLVINAKDEAVNRDIDLKSLTDIKLIIYYTDFVSL